MMERDLPCLEWQFTVKPCAYQEPELVVQRYSKGLGPYLAHYKLPAPSPSPLMYPKVSTNDILMAIPSPGPDAPPFLPATYPTPLEEPPQRSPYPPWTDRAHPATPATPAALHSNSPPANSIPPVTALNSLCENTKTILPAGDNAPPLRPHTYTNKSSSPMPTHQIPVHAKHTAPDTDTWELSDLDLTYIISPPSLAGVPHLRETIDIATNIKMPSPSEHTRNLWCQSEDCHVHQRGGLLTDGV